MAKKSKLGQGLVDHTGAMFNGMTAIRRDEKDLRNRHGTIWLLKCRCGKEFLNYISLIKRGVIKSCGCEHSFSGEKSRSFKNLTGKRFGSLVAMHYVGRTRSPMGIRTMWMFKCDCGEEVSRAITNIVRGTTNSCGCKKSYLISDAKRLPNFAEVFNRAFGAHVHAAIKRGYTTDLTREQYIAIIKKPCIYCGKFSKRKTQCLTRKKGIKMPDPDRVERVNANSVDRINNEPFYNLGNSVPACFTCQTMKSTMSAGRFFEKCREILLFQESNPVST